MSPPPRSADAIYNELLVMRCRRGERDAWEELIRGWEGRLLYYVRRIVTTEEDAWDVLQQTWVKVVSGLDRLRDPAALPSWLYRIARSTAYNHHRAGSSMPTAGEDPVEEVVTEDESSLRFENAERVHAALGELALHHREALTLFFLKDLTIEQIAEVVGIPLGTVKSRLHHARRALRDILETEGPDDA